MSGQRRKIAFARLILLCLPILAHGVCRAGDVPPASLDVASAPAVSLNDYHFFLDPKHQVPNTRVVPYDLNTPHFADYAHLRRFLWLPEGASIVCHETGDLEFPVGAVLILTIGYLNDVRDHALGERMIETRLLVNRKQGWQVAQYNWNQEMTDARLSVAGSRAEVSWIHYDGSRRRHAFLAPNSNQCKQCHEFDGKVVPLGLTRVDRINRVFDYPDGPENQLVRWSKTGHLVGAPADPEQAPRMPVWNDPATGSVEQRARAYLEMNCSSCHRPKGIAYTSGLDLSNGQQPPIRYGVFKAPAAAGRGVGDWRFAIEPGHPERSFLVHRLRSTDPGVRMPIVGRGVMHEEGVALIEQWISEMKFTEMAAAQARADRSGFFRLATSGETAQDKLFPTARESR